MPWCLRASLGFPKVEVDVGDYIKASCFKQHGPDPRDLFLSMASQHLPTSKIIDHGGMVTDTSPQPKRASSGEKWKSAFDEMKAKLGKVLVGQTQ